MTYTRYYFIGIGGIGMSAIARYFHVKGFKVAGYDRTETKLTSDLQAEGIQITFEEAVSTIPSDFLEKEKTLIVITPAIPQDHEQLVYFKEHNFTIMKRSEMLGEITRQSKAICIAGTHGKTTTSTITAHLLYQSHVNCSAFLGGISNNYNTNLLLSNDSNFVVVEADEYDRSFHRLTPYMAVIISVDADHLDIYGSEEAFLESFEHFTSLIAPGGTLVINKNVHITPKLKKGVRMFTYGLNSSADFYAKNIRMEKGNILFDFVTPSDTIYDVRLGVPVMINVENSVAAMAMAWLNGVTNEEIRTGISTFSGIYRRFNIVYKTDKIVYMDDYAHHPSELKESISSIRQLYPGRKITGIFQPHLYSRTKDFATEFAQSLSNLDDVILLPVYPARELPIEGVSSDLILKDVTAQHKTLSTKENLLTLLDEKNLDVLVTFGAGDIDKLVPEIKKYLKKRYK
ncbi:MAG TPA: UDP-N-acetylmuramate--L-alanine ligase [Paludibacteraceae bacterium]|nr:UDP-N-acetylmuramate--L-alanine ligase [Paludibacteraceae bacterium]HPT43147.1 UDP-N-acetylmuramate--L-alanine ligase [Paludibacteraceae bacterium]